MILYSKFNNYRKTKFQLITNIEEDKGEIFSSKTATSPESYAFLNLIFDKYNYLLKSYFSLKPVKPEKIKHNKLIFKYQNLKTIEYILLKALTEKNKENFIEIIKAYISAIKRNKFNDGYLSEDFNKIFNPKSKEKVKDELLNVGCIDLNFNNIFISSKKDDYTLIDYEWTFEFPVPYKYIIFRAITDFYFRYSQYKPNDLIKLDSLYKRFNITSIDEKKYITYEYNFQKYVNNNDFTINTNPKNFYNNYQRLKLNTEPIKYFTPLSNYQSENQNLTKQIEEVNKVVSNYQTENQNLSKQIEEVNKNISDLQTNLNIIISSKYYKIWRIYCKFKDAIK